MSSEARPNAEATDPTWHEIDALVEEIARLSRSDMPAGDFSAEFLGRVVSGLGAVGGMIWTLGPAGQLQPEYRIVSEEMPGLDGPDARSQRARLAADVFARAAPRLVPPRSGPADTDQAVNPTDALLLLCPWTVDETLAGVVEVFHRPGAGPTVERGYLQFLQSVCELLADFHRNRQLRDYQQRAAEWRRLQEFAEQVHRSLDLRATAYAIANESRRVIGCDRVSVLVCRGTRCRLLAVSGVDAVNRRASVVRQLERLSTAVATFDEPLWHPGQLEDLPPEVETRLGACLDESHARAIAVIPLKPPQPEAEAPDRPVGRRPPTLGVLVAERFGAEFDDRMRGAVSAVLGHSATALANALELDRVPMAGLLRALGRARWFLEARQLPKTLLAALALAAVVAALALAPADFRMEARGELQPLATRDVFAPADGVVSEVRAAHGEQVRANQVLLVLRDQQLDLDFKRVWGELQTARKKLASVEAERLQNPRDSEEHRRRYGQLTAQHEELRESIKSLEEQYAILQGKQSELEVRSPIDGAVLTWNVGQLLAARPVSRGQALLTVADLAGPWQIEVRIPDRRVAHVLAAQQELGRELDVAFVLATEPGVPRRGTLSGVGMRTEVSEPDGAFVLARVEIDRHQIPELMPGATVTARIECGRRPVGYVWLHDLIDAIRSWLAL